MKKEIIDFFAQYGQTVEKMQVRAPKGINKDKVELAAENIFYKIQDNELWIKPINLARAVWEESHNIANKEYRNYQQRIEKGLNVYIENRNIRIYSILQSICILALSLYIFYLTW